MTIETEIRSHYNMRVLKSQHVSKITFMGLLVGKEEDSRHAGPPPQGARHDIENGR